MRQLILTLSPEVDEKALVKAIEGFNGVRINSKDKDKEKKLKLIRELGGSVDPSIIDADDERTKYILSK